MRLTNPANKRGDFRRISWVSSKDMACMAYTRGAFISTRKEDSFAHCAGTGTELVCCSPLDRRILCRASPAVHQRAPAATGTRTADFNQSASMSWATAFRRLGHRLGSVDLSCRDFLSWELVNSSMNRTIFSARSVLQLKLNLRRADLVLHQRGSRRAWDCDRACLQ